MKYLKITIAFCFLALLATIASASAPFDTDFLGKTVVFLYRAGEAGRVDFNTPIGTGFLIRVPHLNDQDVTLLLVTARHIVDPEWAHCPAAHNPMLIYARVNAVSTDSTEKVRYIRIPLSSDAKPTWFRHKDEDVDAAVVIFPVTEDDLSKSDFRALPASRLPTDEELSKLSIGDDIVSAGMLLNLRAMQRNYPVFKFGKISSILREDAQTVCGDGAPFDIKAWLIAANLVPGNSGSPILYYPPFGENGDISSPGLQRLVLIGVQSSSVAASDVAFMTPANYVFDIIQSINIRDADLYRGKPRSQK